MCGGGGVPTGGSTDFAGCVLCALLASGEGVFVACTQWGRVRQVRSACSHAPLVNTSLTGLPLVPPPQGAIPEGQATPINMCYARDRGQAPAPAVQNPAEAAEVRCSIDVVL